MPPLSVKMSLPLVIINPASAGGATADAWPKIASELRANFGPFQPALTTKPAEGIEIAADAARKGTKLIIACGGDGTISEVANGILASGCDAELGILPSGTGGDFRRTIDIPNRAGAAAVILRDGQTRSIDVGRASYTTGSVEQETRYFLGVASFGMSADVIARVKAGRPQWLPAKAPRWLTSRFSFGSAMLQSAARMKPTRVLIQLDDKSAQRTTVANLCVANAKYFGGGMKIAPDAKLTDGKFDVVSIGDLSLSRILANAPLLYFGAHLSMPEVQHALAAKITASPIDKDQRIQLELDGELPGFLPATFQIVPRALRIRCPR
ncbi:MAG: diacylglycerol kinase family lipid kinase [Acidobacteria bacterium]|nr:diacylglycerol kinase family lipid kinase [Acidobacteriota bacterium]